MSKELTVKQLLFVENYVKNGFNATNAYLEAGYKVSYNVASINASRLLSNAKIKEVIQNKIDEIIKDKNTLIVRWITEVRRLAFSDLTQIIDIKDNVIIVKDFESIPEELRPCISEISNTTTGIKIKFYAKEKALELLGKYLSILTENVNHTGEVKIVFEDELNPKNY